MRIVIVTQNAPMYLPEFIDKLIKLIKKSNHSLEGIVVLPSYSGNSFVKELIRRYSSYSITVFMKMSFYIAKNKILSMLFKYNYSLNNVLNKYKIRTYKFSSINSFEFLNYIESNNIDLIISIASPQIFKESILKAPKKGCINYHTSLLPKYRGRQPLFWALFNDEKEVGISIHEIDDKLDNGPIIVQKKVKVDASDSLHSLYLKTIEIGPFLLMEAIYKIDNDIKERIQNDIALGSMNRFPERKDVKLFESKRKRFF